MKLKDIFADDRSYIAIKKRSAQFAAKTTQERKAFKQYVADLVSTKKWRLVKTGTKNGTKWWKLKRIKW